MNASALGQAQDKTPFFQREGVKNALQKSGQVLKTAGKLGGGIALGALGGAVSGAGFGDVGRSIQNSGMSLVSGIGRKKSKDEEPPDPPNAPNQQGADNGEDQDLSRPQAVSSEPVNLGSIGKRKANDSSGAKEMQVRDLDQKELDKQGISDIDDSKKVMEFTAKGSSQQAQELGAYADYLDALSPNARRKEVNDRGIEATRTPDGVQVRIDKDKWSRANGGAEISARTNARTKESTMRIKSPEGQKPPSFTGGVKAAPINPVQIPNASQKSISKTKDGRIVEKPEGLPREIMNKGMSPKTAARASERAGLIRDLQAEGYSPSEAARMSKKLMSGIDRTREVSIPKAELSPEQQMTMQKAQQAGQIIDDGSASYKMADRVDKRASVDADPQQETSFANAMGIHRAAMETVNQTQNPNQSPQTGAVPSSGPVSPVRQPRPAGPAPTVSNEENSPEQPDTVPVTRSSASASGNAASTENAAAGPVPSSGRPQGRVNPSAPIGNSQTDSEQSEPAPIPNSSRGNSGASSSTSASGSADAAKPEGSEAASTTPTSTDSHPTSQPAEAPAPMPSQTSGASETNGVSSVQSQSAPSINPELMKRFEAYKQSDAYKASHQNVGRPSPEPAPSQQPGDERGGTESAGLETGRNGSSYTPPKPPESSQKKMERRRNNSNSSRSNNQRNRSDQRDGRRSSEGKRSPKQGRSPDTHGKAKFSQKPPEAPPPTDGLEFDAGDLLDG